MGNDFLITFSVDGTNAIRMMEQIGQRATALEARLNALGRGVGGRGGTTGGVLNSLGLGAGTVVASTRAMSGLESQVARLSAARAAGATLGFNRGFGASAAALQTEAKATLNLGKAYNAAGRDGSVFINRSKQLAASSRIVASQLDDTGQAFGRHARRVFEGILIYEAFGRAVQAVSAGVALIVDIDRESRRLEAVLNIDTTQGQQFVSDLGQIASDTVTPFEHLVSEADRMSAAFLDVEDPVERAADALLLAADAGKFTTVTQRDLGTETTNLIAIMKQLNIPVEDLDDFLGKIVVAGGNASTVIAGLADALQISARAAQQAGVDTDVLLAIESEFLIQTGRTGSEVGNLFKLLFQRLSDPDVAKNIDEITGGLLKMRTAAGAIRDPIDIMLELQALFKEGVITATQFRDVLETFAPPLNPAAKADFILINQLLGQIGTRVDEIAQADAGALNDLVDQINAALGPQFQKLIIDAQRAFVDLFSPGILSVGQSLIDVLRAIGTALGALPPQVLTGVVAFTGLLVAWRLLAFVGKGLGSLLGLGGIAGSLKALGTTSVVAGSTMATSAVGMTLFGKAARVAGILIGGLISQLKILAPLVAVWLAIDFASQVGEMQEGLRTQVGGLITGSNLQELKALRAKIEGQIQDLNKSTLNPLEGIGQVLAQNTLKESLAEVDRAIAEVGQAGPGTTASIDNLSEAFGGASDATKEETERLKELESEFDKALARALGYAGGLKNMTQAQRIAADSTRLLGTLADEQGDKLLDLNDRLKDGKINADEWAQGQNIIAQSAQAAADLVAAMGDELRTMIPELAGAEEGTDGLAEAVFDLLVNAGDALPLIQANVALILKLKSEAQLSAVATDAWASASFRAAAAQAAMTGNLAGLTGLARTFAGGATAAAIATNAWLLSLMRLAAFSAASTGNLSALMRFASLLQSFSTGGSNIAEQIRRAIAQINSAVRTSGSAPFGVGGSSAAASRPQTPVLDIGDLPANQVARLIALATTLRNAIPGETAASKDAVAAIIKDAQFIQQVRGIDDRLLRLALEELTQQMEEANRLKQKEQILQNLVVNAGPLSALVSQPTTFGVGGNIAGGTGLNFDPTKGNFTINVPIELKGLEPAVLQQLVYNIIYRAIADALRL